MPELVAFHAVVASAECAEVGAVGGAAVFVGLGVVLVGAVGWLVAGGEAAGLVAGGDVVAESGGGCVAGVAEVE